MHSLARAQSRGLQRLVMTKISPRLEQFYNTSGHTITVPLNVSIKPGISPQIRNDSIQRVRNLSTNQESVEFIPISGTLHCEVPLSRLQELEAMPQVEWIDLEKERPVAELLDSK